MDIGIETEARTHWLPDLCRTEVLGLVALLAVLLAVILELLFRGTGFDLTSFGQCALLILWMGLIGCFASCGIRRISYAWPVWKVVAAILIGIQVVSLFGTWGQVLVGEPPIGSGTFFNALIPNQLLSFLIGSIVLRLFYLGDKARRREERLKQAEIELLQARIQPHFLFNTLNTIVSLIATDPEKAESAVLDLSDLMRSSLSAGTQMISLSQELELCEKYLQIEALRMGQRLKWAFSVTGDAGAQNVPALSIQPLIENAVLHGLSKIPEGGLLELDAKLEEGVLFLQVKNPVPEDSQTKGAEVRESESLVDTERGQGNQIALKNVVERLQACSQKPITFSAKQELGKYLVSLSLVPEETSRDNR